MIYFIATFFVFLLVIIAMAIGYIFNKKTIRGSCGGLAAVGVDKECDCPEPCDNRIQKIQEAMRVEKLHSEERII